MVCIYTLPYGRIVIALEYYSLIERLLLLMLLMMSVMTTQTTLRTNTIEVFLQFLVLPNHAMVNDFRFQINDV